MQFEDSNDCVFLDTSEKQALVRSQRSIMILALLVDLTGRREEVCSEVGIGRNVISQWHKVGREIGKPKRNWPSTQTAAAILRVCSNYLCGSGQASLRILDSDRLALLLELSRYDNISMHSLLDERLPINTFDRLGQLHAKIVEQFDKMPPTRRPPEWQEIMRISAVSQEFDRTIEHERAAMAEATGLDEEIDRIEIDRLLAVEHGKDAVAVDTAMAGQS